MNSNRAHIYGIFAGIATITYSVIFYLIDPKIMLSGWVYYSSFLFYLIGMFLAVFKAREAEGGLDFRTALSISFKVFLLANIFYYVFSYVMFNYIDPGLIELQKSMMEAFLEGRGDEQSQAMLEEMKKGDLSYSFSTVFFSFAFSTISGFLLSLLVAGIGRNK
ncbi:MAG: DUF4199 domain-containing protein [Bacteroidota bacterium]